MNPPIALPVSQVTATEAAQSGLSTGNARKLTEAKKTRVEKFIKAHLGKPATPVANIAEQGKSQALQAPQISAEEQSAAVSLMGAARTETRRSKSKNAILYHALFKGDSDYL